MDILNQIKEISSSTDVILERFKKGEDPNKIEDERESRKNIKKISNSSFSTGVKKDLKREFSKKCWPFFEIYGRLKLVQMGYEAITEDDVDSFWRASSTIYRQISGAFIEAEFNETTNTVIRTLRAIPRNKGDKRNKKRATFAGEKLRNIYTLIAGDKGINIDEEDDIDGISKFPKLTIGRGGETVPESELEKIAEGIDNSFSNSISKELKRKFKSGGEAFFKMYPRLRLWEDGLKSIRRKEIDEFFDSIKYLRRKTKDGLLSADLKVEMRNFRRMFRKLLRSDKASARRRMARKIGPHLLDIIEKVASTKGVYFKKRPIKGKHWFKLNKARPHDVESQQIAEEDPELHAMKKHEKELTGKLKELALENVVDDGLKVKDANAMYMGKRVVVAVDPETEGEDTETEEIIYDISTGESMPVDEWTENRRKEIESLKKAEDIEAWPEDEDLENIRSHSDEEVQEAIDDQEVRFRAITDDSGKSNPLTRVMPVVTIDGKDVIAGNMVEGDEEGEKDYMPTRFSGIAVEDMVNRYGRMIEGIAYEFVPETGGYRPLEVSGGQDGKKLRGDKEPYVTMADDGRFMVRIPKLHTRSLTGRDREMGKGFTVQRNKLKDLDKSPFVDLTKRDWADTSNQIYKFDPEGFFEVRQALQNFAMSESAAEKIKEHFVDEKTRQEAATKERLVQYTPAMLGGFKDELEFTDSDGDKQKAKFNLNSAQLEALAYLDTNGDKGICALETGVGKTVTAMAYIQNLKRKGVMGEDDKVLYVAPSKLQNNLENQAKKFMKEVDDWNAQIVSMSSRKFLDHSKEDENYMDKFVAVIFDEATETIAGGLGGGKSKTSQAAQREHPRKVMLTASPMNKSPVELYTLNSIVNNVDIANNKEERKKMFSFLHGYGEKMGGRYVGISNDPDKAKAFKQWAKSTMYFADKTEVDGYELPEHNRDTEKVSMEDDLIDRHKLVNRNLYATLRNFKEQLKEIEEEEPPYRIGWTDYTRDEWITNRKLKLAETVRKRKNSSIQKKKDYFREIDMMNLMPGRYKKIEAAAKEAKVSWSEAKTFLGRRWNGESIDRIINKGDKAMDIPMKKAVKLDEAFDYSFDIENNPKGIRASEKVFEGIQDNHRYVMFTDTPQMAASTTQCLAKKVGGKHAVAYSDRWELWVDGTKAKTFTQKEYPEEGEEPPKPVEGDGYGEDEWIDYIINHWISPVESDIHSVILTKSYSHGVNLQAFDKVIHLDRDNWNSETMKQRTARVWRQGQDDPVDEINIDMAYDEEDRDDDLDFTLDDLMKEVQKYDEKLFNELIFMSKDADVTEGWGDVDETRSQYFKIDTRLAEAELSPYVNWAHHVHDDTRHLNIIDEDKD